MLTPLLVGATPPPAGARALTTPAGERSLAAGTDPCLNAPAPVITGYRPNRAVIGLTPVRTRLNVRVQSPCPVLSWDISNSNFLFYVTDQQRDEEFEVPGSNAEAGISTAHLSVTDRGLRTTSAHLPFWLKRQAQWQPGTVQFAARQQGRHSVVVMNGKLIQADWSARRWGAYRQQRVVLQTLVRERGAGQPRWVSMAAGTTSRTGWISLSALAYAPRAWRMVSFATTTFAGAHTPVSTVPPTSATAASTTAAATRSPAIRHTPRL